MTCRCQDQFRDGLLGVRIPKDLIKEFGIEDARGQGPINVRVVLKTMAKLEDTSILETSYQVDKLKALKQKNFPIFLIWFIVYINRLEFKNEDMLPFLIIVLA